MQAVTWEINTGHIDDHEQPIMETHKLMAMDANRLMAIQSWHYYHEADGANWLALSLDSFNDFCMHHLTNMRGPTMKTDTTMEADAFSKGTKCGTDEYKEFKDHKYWNSWHHDLHSTGQNHHVSKVFDGNYVPVMDEEKELFQLQQNFVFSVFTMKLKQADKPRQLAVFVVTQMLMHMSMVMLRRSIKSCLLSLVKVLQLS